MSNKQPWTSPKASVKSSLVEGRGMFANADIRRGEKLIVWGGTYTDKKGAEEYRKQGKLVMQWDDDVYSYEDGDDDDVCSYENGGDDDAYLINHSCDPNMWMADAYTLVAQRDIKQGEELTADYVLWEADENHVSKWECKCGSPLCRGRVTGKDWRDSELQKRYKDHFSPLLNKRIQRMSQAG